MPYLSGIIVLLWLLPLLAWSAPRAVANEFGRTVNFGQLGISPPQIASPVVTREAVLNGAAQWEKAYNAGDVAALAELYAEDAIALFSPSELVGRENIAAVIRLARMQRASVFDFESLAVATGGNIAYDIGRYSITPLGLATPVTGIYVLTWERTFTELRITAHILRPNPAAAVAQQSEQSNNAASAEAASRQLQLRLQQMIQRNHDEAMQRAIKRLGSRPCEYSYNGC